METLLTWGAGALFALIGSGDRLCKSYFRMWHVAFASCLALWACRPVAASMNFLTGDWEAWRPAAAALAVFVAAWGGLAKLAELLNPEAKEFEFPYLPDKIGGTACGLATGLMLAGTLSFAYCLMPASARWSPELRPALAQSSRSALMRTTGTLLLLARRPDDSRQREALLEELLNPPPPEETPEETPKNGAPPPRNGTRNGAPPASPASSRLRR